MAGLHDKPRYEREQEHIPALDGETWISLGNAVAGALTRPETPGEAAGRLLADMDKRRAAS